jgi:hypothetical protein
MHRMRRQIVALIAAGAWLLQAWLSATHVYPHTDGSRDHVAASAVCHAHEHGHAHGHADHGHDSDTPTPDSGNEHDSSDCQICQLLSERPLPLATTVQLTGGTPVVQAVIFAVEVPTVRPARLFQSRAPPAPTV